jgi:hypothetical protein
VQVDSSVIEGKYLQDILDHPRALENTLASLQENPSLGELTARLRKGNFTTLVLTGMGSSFHALHPLQAISSHSCLRSFSCQQDLPALEIDTFPAKQSSVDRPRTRSEHHKTRGQSQQQAMNSPMTSVRDHHPQLNEHFQSP